VDELKANVESLNAQIDAIDKEMKALNQKLTQTAGEKKTLNNALATLELNRKKLVAQISSTNLRIKQTSSTIENTKSKISITEASIQRNRDGLAELLKRQQTNENLIPMLVQMTTKETRLSDLVDVTKRSQDVSSQIQLRLSDLREAQDHLETTKSEYELHKMALVKLQDSLTDQRYLVEQNKEEKSKLLAETKNKESEYQKMLAEQKRKKAELEKEVLDYEAKIQTLVDVSKLPKYGKGVLKYPVDNVNITQTFGTTAFSTQNPQVYNGMGHNGIDFAVPSGTPIYSAGPGTVIGVGDTDAQCSRASYGKFVLIRHTNGLTTLYAHLSKINVNQGQSVTSRQQVGLSGNTGYSTGPHLHFTVYASDAVRMTAPGEYKSRVCGTYMILPVAPRAGYLNPLSYL
jgi:murein DD-endopeptidase MepM/ murein hydrolase activator NlpD